MRLRHAKLAVLGVFLIATFAFGSTYWWKGQGLDGDWDTCGNWTYWGSYNCFAGSCADDAIIPECSPGPCVWAIDLVDEEVDDLTIFGDVDFDSATGGQVTLGVDTLTIVGPATVTISNDATILAPGSCASP